MCHLHCKAGTIYCTLHQNGGSSNKKSESKPASGAKKRYTSKPIIIADPYDVKNYDSAEDFADEWAADFKDWDDAYDYWEDEYGE